MSNVQCSVDGPDEEGVEVEGRRFSTNDEGVPMMCSLVCKSLGRHIHIDYCRAKTPAECRVNNEVEHIMKKLQPQPDRPKDFLAHNLFWKRSGNLIFVIVHPTLCLTHLQGSRIRIRAKIRHRLQNGRLIWLRSSSLPHTYTHLSSDSLCTGVTKFEITYVMGHGTGNPKPAARIRVFWGYGIPNPYPYPRETHGKTRDIP